MFILVFPHHDLFSMELKLRRELMAKLMKIESARHLRSWRAKRREVIHRRAVNLGKPRQRRERVLP